MVEDNPPITAAPAAQERRALAEETHATRRMRVKMDDGTEQEFGPHDALVIPPGHDAWIVGTEPAIVLDFSGAAQYAKL